MTYPSRTALIVAAPTLLRQGLLAMLREAWPTILLTLTADTTQVAELVAHRAFSVVVLDGALPGRALPQLLGQVRQARPGQRVLALAEQPLASLPFGAAGSLILLPRQAPPTDLVASLSPWLAELPAVVYAARPAATLLATSHFSRRELEVLRLVVNDQCNEEIADHLCLSVRTVESHRRALLQKAGTRTLVGLAARAVREGWVA